VIILATACSSLPEPEVKGPQGREFIPTVPDSIDDVGFGDAIAVDGEGLPYVSYFGVPATLEAGEIPVTRPVGSPFLQTEDGKDAGAVLLTSLTQDQIWNRGAVAQPRETPTGLTVPFGPAAEPSLASLTPHTAKGTDIAVAGGDIHVTWTTRTGVWYGMGPDFEVGTVEKSPEAGAPSIAVDAAGNPWVAYTVAGAPPQVHVAERAGEGWRIGVAATLSACGQGCPPATQIGILDGEPLVVVADPRSGQLIAARRDGTAWTSEVISKDVVGGASLATAGGTATLTFYTESGVSVATGRFGAWSVEEVAPVTGRSPSPSPSPSAGPSGSPSPSPATKPIETEPTTAVAVDDEGTTWVAWEDGDGIHLASRKGGDAFEEADLLDTSGGVNPSVAVAADGSSVYLAWFDAEQADLRVGIYAEVSGLLIAAPSPTPAVAVTGPENCGQDGKPVLEITARGTAFDKNCLVAPAGEPFTIAFDNEDPAPTTHNVAIFPDAESTDAIFSEPPFAGPKTVEYNVKALDAETYAFRCEVHPTIMFGTLAVVAGGGK
jgi:hypothetical protein